MAIATCRKESDTLVLRSSLKILAFHEKYVRGHSGAARLPSQVFTKNSIVIKSRNGPGASGSRANEMSL